MKDKIIEAKNIRKKFGNSLALVDINTVVFAIKKQIVIKRHFFKKATSIAN